MFTKINQYVSQKIALSSEEETFFNQLLEYRTIARKQIILQPGEICDFEGFVLKGLFRMYYVNQAGDEVDLSYPAEGWWIGDLVSFSQQVPSKLYIEALEDSEVFVMDYPKKELLFEKVPAFERLFRLMIQRAFETMQNRLIANISDTAESRYLEFLKKYPSVSLRIPQRMIASYLGISPEFLSKIRKRLSEGK